MNPTKKPQPRYKKVKVYKHTFGYWAYLCENCTPHTHLVVHDTHAKAVQAAHQHITTVHNPARPFTHLRQTRPNNWRSQ